MPHHAGGVLFAGRRPAARSRRRGWTLIELLLVLVVIVIAGALAILAIRGAMDGPRLRSAAETVRASWTAARAAAMRTGRVYTFRFAPQEGVYVVAPWFSGDDAIESNLAAQAAGAFDSPGGTRASGESSGSARVLPVNVFFVAAETVVDSRAAFTAEQALAAGGGGETWSDPVFFYPDGTTSDARLTIANDRGRAVTLVLRGLTGVVYVGEVESLEELARLEAQP